MKARNRPEERLETTALLNGTVKVRRSTKLRVAVHEERGRFAGLEAAV